MHMHGELSGIGILERRRIIRWRRIWRPGNRAGAAGAATSACRKQADSEQRSGAEIGETQGHSRLPLWLARIVDLRQSGVKRAGERWDITSVKLGPLESYSG
jgi:hypothetical protein